MNRSVLEIQSSPPVQQMIMAGNPNNWWNMRPSAVPSPFFSTTTPSNSLTPWHDSQELPESWSQLLMSGVVCEEDKASICESKKMENWEEQMKQECSVNSYVYGHGHGNEEFHTWSQMVPAAASSSSSINSCATSFSSSSSSMLDFSNNNSDTRPPPSSDQCNSVAAGGAPVKKARVQSSTTQPTFKVRKEKLGDRIVALHQLVSPFGKTDTASVLLEAIGYIRFLESQIQALTLPYLGSTGSRNMRHQQSVQRDKNCIFPEDPGQLLNENCLKRKAASREQECKEEEKKDLRSRGLCLVPVSCTLQVGNDNGADYWAPSFGGGFR